MPSASCRYALRMDQYLPYVVLAAVILLLGVMPLTIRDKVRARRSEREWHKAAEFAVRHGSELGYRFRLEVGELSGAELEQLWVEMTEFVAATDLPIHRGLLVQMVGNARHAVREAAASPQPEDAPPL